MLTATGSLKNLTVESPSPVIIRIIGITTSRSKVFNYLIEVSHLFTARAWKCSIKMLKLPVTEVSAIA